MSSRADRSSGPGKPSDPLAREVEDALAGVNLQELDEQGRTPAQKKARTERGLVRGTVVGFSGDDAIVELGPTAQGVIPKGQFDELPKIGASFEFSMHGQEDGLWVLSLQEAKALAAWDELAVGARVEARVTGQNTGGLELKIGPISAFMPASHVSLSREENLGQFLNQKLVCEVMEIDAARKRVTLSRRAVLETEREEQRREMVGHLATGQIVQGKVTRVEPYGGFVDLGGGVEGLVHVSNISRKRVENAAEVLKKGDVVKALILEIKEGGKRIGLGLKQLEADPWDEVSSRFAIGQVLQGKVVRLMEFGAFVELSPGIEGLVHVSQLAKDRVRRVQDAVKLGSEVGVRVLSIDKAQKRIALSRLDERNALIGSEDSVASAEIEEMLQKNQPTRSGTNLGSLFKKALDKKK
jgi:small subunit ribosomal protein S1